MGRNRVGTSPEAYPPAFLTAIEYGAGIIYAHDLPWTVGSSMKRFRLLVSLLRKRPDHYLHANALRRWNVVAGKAALEITMCDEGKLPPSVSSALIARALSIG